jgi:3-oxoadipate enol-lactonase
MTSQLFYSAEGKGEPLILLHPVGLDHSFWGPLIKRAAEIHRVISVDLCGHGRSGPALSDRGFSAYVDDIDMLLDDLATPRTTVLGLSFGGMIAQEFAIRNPDRVSRLIVGACGARIAPEMREAVRNRGKISPQTGMAGVVDTTIERWFTRDFIQEPAVERVRQRLLANDPISWAAGWNAIAGFDAFDRLGSVKARTLVVAAEQDAGTPVAATEAIAHAIPQAEFEILPKAPHMMQIECADRFADRVLSFLHS